MKTVIAIDSFKGCLSTLEAGRAVMEGIKNVYPDATIDICPIADGGEGTVNAITSGLGGRIERVSVTGPLGDPVDAEYGIINGNTAVMEMASAAGLTLVPPDLRNPLITTTYGVGEMIKHAITQHGCRKFIIGIGGSATNDGGTGMLSALGFRFMTKANLPISNGCARLQDIRYIETSDAMPQLSECEFHVACDVTNPLCGENGCSLVFGPQKGASITGCYTMDNLMRNYARVTKDTLGKDYSEYPGAGAAGGMGFAFISYLGARLESGIDTVIEAVGLEDKIRKADFVITGEGRLDSQSCMGKAPVGIARIAKKHGVRVIAFAGAVSSDASELNRYGIDAFFPITRSPITLDEAMKPETAYKNLRDTCEQVFRLIRVSD